MNSNDAMSKTESMDSTCIQRNGRDTRQVHALPPKVERVELAVIIRYRRENELVGCGHKRRQDRCRWLVMTEREPGLHLPVHMPVISIICQRGLYQLA